MFQLDQSDAFSNVTYVVFWEQNYLGGSRRLRSTHIFGDGVMSSESVLTILPVSAQIGESGDTYTEDTGGTASSVTTPSSVPSPSADDSGGVNWALIGTVIGIVVGVILCGIGMYSALKSGDFFSGYTKLLDSNQNKPLRAIPRDEYTKINVDGYTKVRRNERFATTDF